MPAPTPRTRLIGLLALPVLLLPALTGCGDGEPGGAPSSSASASPANPSPVESTLDTGEAPDPRHNEADAEFAAAALVHHRLTIELAEMLLDEPDAPQPLRDLAQGLVDERGPQTITLADALELWGEDLPGGGPVTLGDDTADFEDLRAVTRSSIRLLAEQAGTEQFVASWALALGLHQSALIDPAERILDEGVSGTTQQVAGDYVDSYAEVERTLGSVSG